LLNRIDRESVGTHLSEYSTHSGIRKCNFARSLALTLCQWLFLNCLYRKLASIGLFDIHFLHVREVLDDSLRFTTGGEFDGIFLDDKFTGWIRCKCPSHTESSPDSGYADTDYGKPNKK
jgi:hypothetical protein